MRKGEKQKMRLKFTYQKHGTAADGTKQIALNAIMTVPEFVEFAKLIGHTQEDAENMAEGVPSGGTGAPGVEYFLDCTLNGGELVVSVPEPGAGIAPKPLRLTFQQGSLRVASTPDSAASGPTQALPVPE